MDINSDRKVCSDWGETLVGSDPTMKGRSCETLRSSSSSFELRALGGNIVVGGISWLWLSDCTHCRKTLVIMFLCRYKNDWVKFQANSPQLLRQISSRCAFLSEITRKKKLRTPISQSTYLRPRSVILTNYLWFWTAGLLHRELLSTHLERVLSVLLRFKPCWSC